MPHPVLNGAYVKRGAQHPCRERRTEGLQIPFRFVEPGTLRNILAAIEHVPFPVSRGRREHKAAVRSPRLTSYPWIAASFVPKEKPTCRRTSKQPAPSTPRFPLADLPTAPRGASNSRFSAYQSCADKPAVESPHGLLSAFPMSMRRSLRAASRQVQRVLLSASPVAPQRQSTSEPPRSLLRFSRREQPTGWVEPVMTFRDCHFKYLRKVPPQMIHNPKGGALLLFVDAAESAGSRPESGCLPTSHTAGTA